jgi:lysophospholipase L1-like esterase
VCPVAEDHAGPTVPTDDGTFQVVATPPEARVEPLTLRRVRQMLSTIVEQRRAAGDEQLWYLDGLELFGADDHQLLYDGLHPSPEGYALVGQRFAEKVFGAGGPFAERRWVDR